MKINNEQYTEKDIREAIEYWNNCDGNQMALEEEGELDSIDLEAANKAWKVMFWALHSMLQLQQNKETINVECITNSFSEESLWEDRDER